METTYQNKQWKYGKVVGSFPLCHCERSEAIFSRGSSPFAGSIPGTGKIAALRSQ